MQRRKMVILKNLGIELSIVPRLVSSNKFSFSKSELTCSREYHLGCVAHKNVLFSQEGLALSDQKGGCVWNAPRKEEEEEMTCSSKMKYNCKLKCHPVLKKSLFYLIGYQGKKCHTEVYVSGKVKLWDVTSESGFKEVLLGWGRAGVIKYCLNKNILRGKS